MTLTLTTEFGSVDFLDAPASMVHLLQASLPMGTLTHSGRADGGAADIVTHCGDLALRAVTYATVRLSGRTDLLNDLNLNWIATVLADYRRKQFDGVLIPGRYIRGRTRRTSEIGLALFAFPAPQDLSRAQAKLQPSALCMATAFASVYQSFCKEAGFVGIRKEPHTAVRVDALQCLYLDFMIVGQNILYLKSKIDPKAHIWSILAHEGIRRVIHVPSAAADQIGAVG